MGPASPRILEAIGVWHAQHQGRSKWSGLRADPEYLFQTDAQPSEHISTAGPLVKLSFHEKTPTDPEVLKRLVNSRSPYRNTQVSEVKTLQAVADFGSEPNPTSMSGNDDRITRHYARMAGLSFQDFFSEKDDDKTKREIKNATLKKLNGALARVFPDLQLKSFGLPPQEGTFVFQKGEAEFKFKNLSSGEREVFDLLLDAHVSSLEDAAHLVCIDEPEAHMSIDAQARLLPALDALLPPDAQVWIATHSPGIISHARRESRKQPRRFAFLDVGDVDPKEPGVLRPVSTASKFWQRAITYVLGDMGGSIGPEVVYLCEGEPTSAASLDAKDFDSRVFSKIFEDDYPSVSFVSVGSGSAIPKSKSLVVAISPDARTVGVFDRDGKTQEQVDEIQNRGDVVLSRRELENFLLNSEILEKLVRKALVTTQEEATQETEIQARVQALVGVLAKPKTGVASDDVKSRAKDVFNSLKSVLPEMTQPGTSHRRFLSDVLAPLVTQETQSYRDLRSDLRL